MGERLKNMLNRIDEKYDKSEGMFFYDILNAVAIELQLQEGDIKKAEEKFDIYNYKADDLTKYVYQRTGVIRKEATKSSGLVEVKGNAGAKISKGDIVGSDSINFLFLEDYVLGTEGKANCKVECEYYGRIGNLPAGAINKFPMTIAGITECKNLEAFTNGYEAESDEDLIERYFEKLQKPAKAGNVFHYEQWAKEVVGVGGARVISRWNGPLTVKVIIIDSYKTPAEEELLNTVAEHIEIERPFGAIVTVVSAFPISIDISAEFIIAEGYALEEVKAKIKTNITKYLEGIAFKENYVSYAKIGSIIIDTEGILDYKNLILNGGTGNIEIPFDKVAIMGEVS